MTVAVQSIHHFGLYTIAILVPDTQFRRGRTQNTLAAILIQPGGGNTIVAMRASGDEGGPHPQSALASLAIGKPHGQSRLGGPPRAGGSILLHIRHTVPHRRRRVDHEQIVRQPAQVYMTIGGNTAVFHAISHERFHLKRNLP